MCANSLGSWALDYATKRNGSVSDDCYTISLIQFGKSFSQSDLVIPHTLQAYKQLW